MRTLGLMVFGQATLTGGDSFAGIYSDLFGTSADATGAVQLGPSSPGEIWFPSVASVGTEETSVTSEAACKIYCGPFAAQPFYVDGTLSGSTGDSSSNVAGQAVYPGQYIIAVWSGGDSGAVAFLNIQGTRQVP